MCGIFASLFRKDSVSFPDRQKHRGPDESIELSYSCEEKQMGVFCRFDRLAIVGGQDGHQPFCYPDSKNPDLIVMVNGEIYNYREIAERYGLTLKTHSDCEVVALLYQELAKKHLPIETLPQILDGEFAFVIIDRKRKCAFFARDRFGIKPLYYQLTDDGLFLCSEFKTLITSGESPIYHVHPRILYKFDFQADWITRSVYYILPKNTVAYRPLSPIVDLLTDAVRKRMYQGEREVGFLLSGGFDSSLILSIALKLNSELSCWNTKKNIQVFTIGFTEEASDVKNAKLMAKFLKDVYGDVFKHHVVILPVEEGLKVVDDVIYHLETYDTTTIRASVPMYLISKYISENTDVKVLFTGEFADELAGGYMYFKYAPSHQEFSEEVVNLLEEIHFFDALRADRTTAAWGLELRPPFSDTALVEYVLGCSQLTQYCSLTKEEEKKFGNTKMILREAFRDTYLLPPVILDGRKEAFSDAVGDVWKKALKNHAEKTMEGVSLDGLNLPVRATTPEARWFQSLFYLYFGNTDILPHLWLPNQEWVQTGDEPSATVLGKYSESAQE